MRIVSVNVGRSRECQVRGDLVRTAIYKDPATGPITVGRLGFDGDEQADLTVHGGANKAVYAYPSEHTHSGARSFRMPIFLGVRLARI